VSRRGIGSSRMPLLCANSTSHLAMSIDQTSIHTHQFPIACARRVKNARNTNGSQLRGRVGEPTASQSEARGLWGSNGDNERTQLGGCANVTLRSALGATKLHAFCSQLAHEYSAPSMNFSKNISPRAHIPFGWHTCYLATASIVSPSAKLIHGASIPAVRGLGKWTAQDEWLMHPVLTSLPGHRRYGMWKQNKSQACS